MNANATAIPADWPVQPIEGDAVHDAAAPTYCCTCFLFWDDAIVTSMTPAPSARCPFENFHDDPRLRVDHGEPLT